MRNRLSGSIVLVLASALLVASAAADELVFQTITDNGYFTPFNASTPAGVRYGDGGWLSAYQPESYTLTEIYLKLATSGSATAGTTDLTFTFNDGDPSGLVFGSGAPLYSTTIPNVELPAATGGEPAYFTLFIALPYVHTLGGYNNIGWSVGVENFNYAGDFGFQCSTASGQQVGYYTNNASYYDGANWSLFSFGADPNTGVANFGATIWTPEPTAVALVLIAAGLVRRR